MITIPEGKKIVYQRLDFSIPAGNSSFSAQETFREGLCIGVKVVQFAGGTPDSAVNVSVQDTSKTEVLGSTDYRDYSHTGGNYLESFKAARFSTRGSITISLTAEKATAADFTGQVILAIIE